MQAAYLDVTALIERLHRQFLEVVTSDPGITGVSIASQSNFALTPGDISFTSDSIAVNWAGLTFGPSSAVTLDVSFGTAVPEPASLTLFASALIGFGALRRRKRV